MNYKDGKLAKEILDLQNEDGTWGLSFHCLSLPNKRHPLTTEQALRRLKALGFTIKDAPIRKAVTCMRSCLVGERRIDAYSEKSHDWALFTQLMLSAWIRIFDPENEPALAFARRWATIIEKAFECGTYRNDSYLDAYRCEFSSKPRGPRELDFSDFYHIHLLQGVLSQETEARLLDYIIAKPNGLYYVYGKPLNTPPAVFASKESNWYLAALDVLSGYQSAKAKLRFAIDWIENNKDENGQWDLGKDAKDNVNLPLSDSWRKPEYRKADCTERITDLLLKLRS